MAADTEPMEVNLGAYVVMLDGKIVEILHKSGIDIRMHVNHVAVKTEALEDGGFQMEIGAEAGGKIREGVRLKIPEDKSAGMVALLKKANELRED